MKFDFHQFDDVFYNGTVMVKYRRGLVRAYDCQRSCLLTKGCRGFNMQWIDDIAAVGYCDLVDMRLAKALSSKSNYSVYALCPSGMIFYSTTSRCYKVIRKRKSWSESELHCSSLYDQAHLMEIYDSIQQELFKNMTEDFIETNPTNLSFGLWLGASRSTEGVDVVWSSTLESVISSSYSNFEDGEPTEQASGKDCLRSFRNQWSMSLCSEIKAFVCEY
ncbi:hypothetical protein LSH36_2139g00005 [Paralvinella palmiformis]|uniref:C-type lectin domain-containing protein n=1 Tax=Paralvinella palmiformis TaxID=53620 RepID=A0AAD9IQQ3_9ANNE|nr:hypothetical protein LSH36_2139g00005 [Paralvinella palmiformis]